ncbi:hypothetical protein [Hydrogenobacter thermophilus]|uniref:hypothetical protein n=1 Tax=Hydrogenobacter thermophilus TaxID=940 RepID=UPI0030F86DED
MKHEELLSIYRSRAKQFYYAFVSFLSLVFLGSLLLYPFFKLPLPSKLVLYASFSVTFVGMISLPFSLFIRKRYFPIDTSQDAYWSYTATKRYFWAFVIAGLPFATAFLIYIIFASIIVLFLGYFLTLCGLIFIKPREEDVL